MLEVRLTTVGYKLFTKQVILFLLLVFRQVNVQKLKTPHQKHYLAIHFMQINQFTRLKLLTHYFSTVDGLRLLHYSLDAINAPV